MRKARFLTTFVLLGQVLPVAPADAAATVQVRQGGRLHKHGTGYLVESYCLANALPMTDLTLPTPDIPLSTTVRCSVNDVEATDSRPGSAATAAIVTVSTNVIIWCISGSGAFFDPDDGVVYVIEAPERCIDLTQVA